MQNGATLRGRVLKKTWAYDPSLYAPPRFRKACTYEAFLPETIEDLSLELPGTLAGVVSDAETAIASLDRVAAPELMPFGRLLLRTESIASSKIEGMQVDGRALARAEARRETGGRVDPEAGEILANIDAMELAVERAAQTPIRIRSLVEIHAALMRHDPRGRLGGRIRDRQNWIGGNDYNPCDADYVPPPHEEVEGLLHDLCRFCERDDLPPLIMAAIAHAQFETIHPFEDGNGRMGRALIHIVLRRRNLASTFVPPISVVLSHAKDRYIGGLADFREGRVEAWIEYFSTTAARAVSLARTYLDATIALQDQWVAMLRNHGAPRADAAAWSVIDALPAHPVITVPVAVAATRRSRPAVSNAIAMLEEAGVLLSLTHSSRNRAWEAVGLLDLIARIE